MAEKRIPPTSSGHFAFTLTLATFALAGLFIGCGDMQGDVALNQRPKVEFTNVPADSALFSYAPIVTWKGRDADGFVESYSYADITDSTALLNPERFIDFIPPEAWIQTTVTSDTVYLLSARGDTTEHVFYVKCTDDRGQESDIRADSSYRTFFRSNRPPNVPEIKWMFFADSTYGENITVPDTIFSLDEPNETWPGLGFNWRSTDPDDRELYRIPLQYRYFLVKTPHDTVWQWTSRVWTSKQDLTFAGLTTGHYIFTVLARDDGYEVSARAASASFDVFQPSFEKSILLLNTTLEAPTDAGRGNIQGTAVGDLYKQLAVNYPDAEYRHYVSGDGMILHKSFLGGFRLVIWFSESMTANNAPDNVPSFEEKLSEYVKIGGKLWVVGNFVGRNILMAPDTTFSPLPPTRYTKILALMGGSSLSPDGPTSGVTFPPLSAAEFFGASAFVDDLPPQMVDMSKTKRIYRAYWRADTLSTPCPGVDILARGNGAEIAYTFRSVSEFDSGDVHDELAEVKANIDTIYYPPTPVDCMIKLNRDRVLEVTRVQNVTRARLEGHDVIGRVISLTNNVGATRQTVIRVSYAYGEPWATTDTIRVDYRFQPQSVYSFKPVGLRYEKLVVDQGTNFIVRYRVAVFTFPLYYLDNSNGDVTTMFNSMIAWFFLPYAH